MFILEARNSGSSILFLTLKTERNPATFLLLNGTVHGYMYVYGSEYHLSSSTLLPFKQIEDAFTRSNACPALSARNHDSSHSYAPGDISLFLERRISFAPI
jgi:hypothetical protein